MRPLLVALAGLLVLPVVAQVPPLPVAEPRPDREGPRSVIRIEAPPQAVDRAVEERLGGILAELPGLQGVTVRVSDGIIVLGGTVDAAQARARAQSLAERMEGAVAVVNGVARERSASRRIGAAVDAVRARLRELAGSGPLLLLALAVVGMAVALARVLGRTDRLFRPLSANWFVRDLLRRVAQLGVVVAGVVTALQLLDANALLGSLLGALGIFGLALGFAVRDTVENYIASILLSVRQPFRPHDHITVDGIEGKVLKLTSRATVLISLDGNHIRIPNARVFKGTIVNFTRNPLRRFEFDVGVATDIDLGPPRDLALATLAALPGVLTTPRPVCLVAALGDSRVVLCVQAWLDQRQSDFLKLRSEAQRVVKDAFDEAGIVMPEPAYNINLRRPAPAGKAAAAARGPGAGPADIAPDPAVSEQIRAERRESAADDLLSESAPTE